MNRWTLNDGEYGNPVFSHMMSFSFSLDDDEQKIVDSSTEWSENGDMAFPCYVKVPELKEPFTLVMKDSKNAKIYKGCTFNAKSSLYEHFMPNTPHGIKNGLSIKFEGKKEYTLEEYREKIIDEIV